MSRLIIPKVVHKDVPGLQRAPQAPIIFSTEPHRNVGQPGFTREIPVLPDELLIATLVHWGQPRWSADQVRHHPFARFCAVKFWCDVQDAAEGDKAAKERVDYCRAMWIDMRRNEMISDIPNHVSGPL